MAGESYQRAYGVSVGSLWMGNICSQQNYTTIHDEYDNNAL